MAPHGRALVDVMACSGSPLTVCGDVRAEALQQGCIRPSLVFETLKSLQV